MQLTVDTSWWTRYRSDAKNPDLDPTFTFPQAVPDLFSPGGFPAIPRSDADLSPPAHIQAIANTAGFHFPTIEQGGTSLYPAMAQRATHVEVLRILISIGPTETMHFQTWSDKAGNAPPLIDPTNGLTFPDLNAPPFGGETFKTNLIMPEPCPFLSRKLPIVSLIRPTETSGIAMGVVNFLTAMGLFIGQSPQFFELLKDLALALGEGAEGRLPRRSVTVHAEAVHEARQQPGAEIAAAAVDLADRHQQLIGRAVLEDLDVPINLLSGFARSRALGLAGAYDDAKSEGNPESWNEPR